MRNGLVMFCVAVAMAALWSCAPGPSPAGKAAEKSAAKAAVAPADAAKWGCVGGMTVRRDDAPVKNTADKEVYLTERYGLTAYRIPAKNGSYAVKLHFAETYEGVDEAGKRLFSVRIEGQPVLPNLDVYKEAGNQRFAAIVKPFDTEVKDGELTIEFQENVQKTMVNGIEVLGKPGAPTTGFELRIDCGADADYKDKAGHVWKKDQEFKAQP